MRIGPADARWYNTNSGAPAELIKYPQTLDPRCPAFYRGAKLPKFRPQSSSDRPIFELGHFIGKQKHTSVRETGQLAGAVCWSCWWSTLRPQSSRLELETAQLSPKAAVRYRITAADRRKAKWPPRRRDGPERLRGSERRRGSRRRDSSNQRGGRKTCPSPTPWSRWDSRRRDSSTSAKPPTSTKDHFALPASLCCSACCFALVTVFLSLYVRPPSVATPFPVTLP